MAAPQASLTAWVSPVVGAALNLGIGAALFPGAALLSRGVQRGMGRDIVLALSGRATLPSGFTVY